MIEDKAPELRPKRPIYRSYGELIRVLTSDAISRVKADKNHEIPPLVVTPQMRALSVRVLALRKSLKAVEKVLSDTHKARVPDYCNCDESKIKLEYTYSENNRLREQRPASMQVRLDKIKRLRVKATLDTIDMTPTHAKAYLLKMERELSGV